MMDDKDLIGLLKSEKYYDDELYGHFDEFNARDWPDAGAEGSRVFGLVIYGEEDFVEDGSPMDAVFSAVAFSGYNAAVTVIAEMLGLDPELLQHAASDQGNGDSGCELPPGIERLTALYQGAADFKKRLDSVEFNRPISSSPSDA